MQDYEWNYPSLQSKASKIYIVDGYTHARRIRTIIALGFLVEGKLNELLY